MKSLNGRKLRQRTKNSARKNKEQKKFFSNLQNEGRGLSSKSLNELSQQHQQIRRKKYVENVRKALSAVNDRDFFSLSN